MKRVLAVLAFAVATASCSSSHIVTSIEPSTVRWYASDLEVQFSLSGGYYSPLLCTFTLRNTSQYVGSYPVPLIMPGAGDTNKNNVKMFDSRGSAVPIVGVHFDWYAGNRPTIELGPDEIASFSFDLDFHFPRDEPGQYTVQVSYFSKPDDEATWDGTVESEPISITVEPAQESSWLAR